MDLPLNKIGECLWELPQTGRMRVPARIYATEGMLRHIVADNAAQQAANVAQLPGIVTASLAMPDIHWGYGFPIGGVAAFDVDEGVVSPGGVGYDINCGVRLMASNLALEEVRPQLAALLNELFRRVPTGVGAAVAARLPDKELRKVAVEGARWAVAQGLGTESDLDRIEENGSMRDADPAQVSGRAWQRGRDQVGTLGSGNHFLEIGYVAEVYDEAAARTFGLVPGCVTLSIHCGSRGFGHQVCDDYLQTMDRAARAYGIELPDRQLACAPVASREGQAYLGAMRCAINYAFANRQVIAHRAREAFEQVLRRPAGELGLRTVYEVAHNIAKLERHVVDGRERTLCVHRKGATRAFAAGRRELPSAYAAVGQPVLIPGDMGRCSYVLVGTEKAMADTFGSSCHGAGRAMSRHQAIREGHNRDIARELAARDILVRAGNRQTLCEEMPEAYKDVTEVVRAVAEAGIARKVAQLRPIGCIKG